MSADDELGTEAKRTAIEVMACVPWLKRDLIERILRPAGVPIEICHKHLNRFDELTGKKLTKRAAAPHILAEMEARAHGLCERYSRSVPAGPTSTYTSARWGLGLQWRKPRRS